MLDQGEGRPKDEVQARRQYTLAAAQGHAEAQYGLGIMLKLGLGGPKDEVEARRQFTLAAAQKGCGGAVQRRCHARSRARRA